MRFVNVNSGSGHRFGQVGKEPYFHARFDLKKSWNNKLLVCDSNKETLEQWHDSNHECFESISEMLKSHQPDFAVIATPPESHFSIAKQLMERKINVLVEKPLSQNLDDANSLLDQSEESGCILSVGVLLRFHSGIMLAKKSFPQGGLETLFHCALNVIRLAISLNMQI